MSRFHFPCTGKNKLPVDKCRLSRNGGFRFSRGEGGGGVLASRIKFVGSVGFS